MADEIYINTGTTIQQPYQGQAIVTGTTPVIRQRIAQTPVIGRTPFTYSNRSPFTYQAIGRTPVPYQHQVPATYVGQGRQPVIYQSAVPATYRNPVDAQQPYIANARQPSTYQNQIQTPYIAQARQPSTYSLQGQIPYQNPVIANQPYPVISQARQPFTYQNRQPYPYIANAQQPYPYIANGQALANTQQPYSYPYIANAQVTSQQPASYRNPIIASRQTTINHANPVIAQQPLATNAQYNRIVQVTYQTPYEYQASAQQTAQAQSPYIAQVQGNYSYRQPAIYTYEAQSIAQRPVIYQAIGNYQVSYQAQADQPYIYQKPIANPTQAQQQNVVAYQYPDPLIGEYFHRTGNWQGGYTMGSIIGTDLYAGFGSLVGSYLVPAGADGNTQGQNGSGTFFSTYYPPNPGTIPANWRTTQRMGGSLGWTGLFSHDPVVNNHIQLKPTQPMRLNADGQWSRIEYAYWNSQTNSWTHISGIPKTYMQAVNPTAWNIQGTNWIVGGSSTPAQTYSIINADKRLRFY